MGDSQALVVANDASVASPWRNAHVVRTMLHMIAWLDAAAAATTVVVLGGDYARDPAIANVLRETYPSTNVVLSARSTESFADAIT